MRNKGRLQEPCLTIQPQFLAKTGSCISKDCNLDAWRFEFLLKCRRYVSQYTGCQVLWIPSRRFYHLRITASSGGLFLLFWNKTVYCEQEVALEIIISILHSTRTPLQPLDLTKKQNSCCVSEMHSSQPSMEPYFLCNQCYDWTQEHPH